MILKEAYRYQNYLDKLIKEAKYYVTKNDFITNITEVHSRKKVNPNAEDETIILKNFEVDYTPMEIIDFLCQAINEKETLSKAIAETKKSTEIDIDSSIAMNKIKQSFVDILDHMASVKSKEFVTKGMDYKFNENGEQVSYRYDINNIVTINFDRNDIRNLSKKYKKQADEISTKLDIIELTAVVDYMPKWEIDETLEEILSK